MQETTVVHPTRHSRQFTAGQGVDLETLYTIPGNGFDWLQTPDQLMSGSYHQMVWQEVSRLTGDDHLDLYLGKLFHGANFGLSGYILLRYKTLDDVVEPMSHDSRLFVQTAQIRFSKSYTGVSWQYEVDRNLVDNDLVNKNLVDKATLPPSQSYRHRVKQAIAHRLQDNLPTVNAIAHELAISARHLQRELKAEGTSFQKLLDEIRQQVALRHLTNPAIPIHDIALVLGFSEPSAFSRAFKRWMGTTPSQFRVALHAGKD